MSESRAAVINRTQQVVLGFVILVWLVLLVVLLLAPRILDRSLRQTEAPQQLIDLGVLAALTSLLGLLGLAVVRRWRWAFWVILLGFFGGLLRVPVATLELTGHLSTADPAWYVVVQAVIGVIQFMIAIAMFIGYRRAGIWGEF